MLFNMRSTGNTLHTLKQEEKDINFFDSLHLLEFKLKQHKSVILVQSELYFSTFPQNVDLKCQWLHQ